MTWHFSTALIDEMEGMECENSLCSQGPTPTNSMRTMEDMEQARTAGNSHLRKPYGMFPTPTKRDYKGTQPGGRIRDGKLQTDTLDRAVDPLGEEGGSLNPQFVRRVAHGISYRVHRLKALGNAQVPLVVVEAWSRLIQK